MSFNLLQDNKLDVVATNGARDGAEAQKLEGAGFIIDTMRCDAEGAVTPSESTSIALDSGYIAKNDNSNNKDSDGHQDTGKDDDHDDDDDESDSEDSWAEISKGRYFGAAEATDTRLCHNCKGSGHISRDCPHSLCRTCGALDDHDTARCPMTQRCFNCSRLGHIAPACPEPQRQSGSFCKSCGSRTHLDRSCPQIWRLYIPSPTFNPDGPWKCEAWCYNCAAKGHYGDECGKARRTRVVDQSAFCIGNQPTTRAERERADREAARTLARQRARNAEEMKDDWFARRQHAHIDSYRPLSSQNGGRGTNGSGGSYGSSGGGMYRGPVVGKGSRYNPYARPGASDSSRSQMKREDRFDRRPPPSLPPSSSFSLRSRDSRNGERERGRERNGNSLAQRFSR